jgi:DNA polymerase
MSAPGYGDPNAKIMLIGQSLHSYNPETPRCQIPFVGPSTIYDSGNILFDAIRESGFAPRQLYITNVVHCHPPKNRWTQAEDRAAIECRPFLLKEIELVRPILIVALGNKAGRELDIHTRDRISAIHLPIGRRNRKFWAVLVYHPAYYLRGHKDTAPYKAYFKWLLNRFMRERKR